MITNEKYMTDFCMQIIIQVNAWSLSLLVVSDDAAHDSVHKLFFWGNNSLAHVISS